MNCTVFMFNYAKSTKIRQHLIATVENISLCVIFLHSYNKSDMDICMNCTVFMFNYAKSTKIRQHLIATVENISLALL